MYLTVCMRSLLLGGCFGVYVTVSSMFLFLREMRLTFLKAFSGLLVSMVDASQGSILDRSVPTSLLVRVG